MAKEQSKFGSILEKSTTKTVSQRIKETLDEESYKDFQEALSNPAVTSTAIQRALKSMGLDVHPMSIQRMRHK